MMEELKYRCLCGAHSNTQFEAQKHAQMFHYFRKIPYGYKLKNLIKNLNDINCIICFFCGEILNITPYDLKNEYGKKYYVDTLTKHSLEKCINTPLFFCQREKEWFPMRKHFQCHLNECSNYIDNNDFISQD